MKPRFYPVLYLILAALGLILPYLFPTLITQLAYLWLMIIFALTWDICGGQMGYNSFGNVIFFGIGCYVVALLQRDAHLSYFLSIFLGMGISSVIAVLVAALAGPYILAMRGQYFAICTLSLGVAAADFFSAWDYVGAGSGIVTQLYPYDIESQRSFFYYVLFSIMVVTFITLKWLYRTRFGLVINAIRDDEDKAESLGIHTTYHKVLAWMIAAFFLALAGGPMGNLVGFVDPRELAFAGSTFGVWMVLMAILGGKGTLWGPVIGAAIFHITQELFWTYLFGWQRVALGFFIVLIVVFFPQGILGWVSHWKRNPIKE